MPEIDALREYIFCKEKVKLSDDQLSAIVLNKDYSGVIHGTAVIGGIHSGWIACSQDLVTGDVRLAASPQLT